MVRTTLTLDDDVAAKLRSEARDSGQPFRQVVNEVIRRGLTRQRAAESAAPFRVAARDREVAAEQLECVFSPRDRRLRASAGRLASKRDFDSSAGPPAPCQPF